MITRSPRFTASDCIMPPRGSPLRAARVGDERVSFTSVEIQTSAGASARAASCRSSELWQRLVSPRQPARKRGRGVVEHLAERAVHSMSAACSPRTLPSSSERRWKSR